MRKSWKERGEAISEAGVIHETRTSFLKLFTWIPSFLHPPSHTKNEGKKLPPYRSSDGMVSNCWPGKEQRVGNLIIREWVSQSIITTWEEMIKELKTSGILVSILQSVIHEALVVGTDWDLLLSGKRWCWEEGVTSFYLNFTNFFLSC